MRAQVLNNTEGVIYAQMPHTVSAPLGNDKRGVIEHGEVVTIGLGLNFIDSKKLEVLRKNPAFESLFKARLMPSKAPERNPQNFGKAHLEIVGKEVPDEYPLAKLADAACLSMLSLVQSTDLLADWLKQEARPEIRKAIEERAVALTSQVAAA